LESYIASSEEFISSLMVVELEGNALYHLTSEELPPFDLKAFVENHPQIFQDKKTYTEVHDAHLIIVQPAILAKTEIKGFTIIAWSTHTLDLETQQAILVAAVALGAIIIIIVFILTFVIGRETKRLTQLIHLLRNLAEGGSDFTKRLQITSQDEIGQLAHWFNEMLSNLQKSNEKQQWFIDGQTGVHERLQGEQKLILILQHTINYLADFLDAQVGVFYIMTENRLKLVSSYAYKIRNANFNEFELGEGLVGQAALEKKSLLFTTPPQEHVQTTINTGLSEILPDTILVLPLIHQDQVIGVLELGTSGSFSESALEFLDSVAESIAISLYSSQSRDQLQELLEETQEQSNKLQSQQEEIRVSNEELETQTKALETQQVQTQAKNIELEKAQQELEEKAKALESSNTYKSEFLANMSHELRTPLNSLLLLADSLASNKTGNLTEKQIKFATTIHSSGEELLQLINEILDLSKIESGKLEISPEHYELHGLRDYIERNFQPVTDKKGISLLIKIDEEIPQTFYTDPQRLEQILKNFMSNAIKFTDKGGITLHIHTPDPNQEFVVNTLSPEKTIAFSVIDTGLGIPEEKQKLIFEAFQQADGSTSRKYGGTGLGLSISKELAKLLGGEILIQSKENQGSIFTLCLPIPEPSDIPPPEVSQDFSSSSVDSPPLSENVFSNSSPPAPSLSESDISDDRAQITTQDRTLLVIEDDAKFSQIVMEQAHEKGFKVIVAESGEEGLDLAISHQPSAIILDVGLPKIDGWDVMEQLKKSPETRHIPVHFISASDQDMKAMEMGAIGFFSKPISQEHLESALQKIENTISKTHHHVLVIEDNENQRMAMKELVQGLDVELTQVETAEEAYELVKIQAFDCVILDLGLKNMSGEERLQKIHADKSLNLPPVIVYTGKDLSRKDEKMLEQYTESIIVKGAKSMDRLIGELNLFLHRVETNLPEEKQSVNETVSHNSGKLEGKVVLLAEDDSRSSFALSHHLEEHGLIVRQAFDGKEAIEALNDDPEVDVVLTDIMMPEMDGYETMKAIREQDRFKKLPIIALTAKAMKQDRQKCIEAGANDYLSKPIDVDKLFSLLKVWVKNP